MKKQLFKLTSVKGLVPFLTLLSTVSSLTINAQRLVITSDNVTITETSSGSDTQVTVEWDLAGDGNIIYASQFGEPIESGSSEDTLADHTETRIGSNTPVPGITGVSEVDYSGCSGEVTYAQAVALAELYGTRLPTEQEVKEGAVASTGCGYNAVPVRTQTQGSAPGERIAVQGSGAGASQSDSESATHPVRYIYDNTPLTTKNIIPSTVDFTVYGGSTVVMVDDGTGADAVADDNIWTAQYTATSGHSGSPENISITVENSIGISTLNEDVSPPVITSGAAGTDLEENSGAGQTVYTTVAADNVGVTSYTLAGTDAGLLAISASGVVTLTVNPDFETKSNYSFEVIVADAAGNIAIQAVTFSITNVDDEVLAPTLAITNDNGSSNSDGITNDATLTISGLEIGASYEFSRDGGNNWIPIDVAAANVENFNGALTSPGILDDSPTVTATTISVAQSLDPYSGDVPDTFFLDITTPTGSTDKEVLFESGGEGRGITIFIDGTDLKISVGNDGDASDLTASGVFADGTRYAIIVELASGNTVNFYVAEMSGSDLPMTFGAAVASQANAWSGDWCGPNALGWGRVASNSAQGQPVNTYEEFSGTLHEGRFYSAKGFSDVWTDGTDPLTSFSGTIIARQTDTANNTSENSNEIEITFETTAPTIDTVSIASEINEGSTTLGSLSADEEVTWSVSLAGISVNVDGVLTLDTPADYESASSYTFTITATDIAGNQSNTGDITVSVNETIEITDAQTINTNIDGGVEITDTGSLTVADGADINGDVTITDGGSLIVTDGGNVTGTVTYVRSISTTNWYLISSPVTGQDIDEFVANSNLATGTGDNIGFSDYENATGIWTYYQAGTTGTGNFVSGKGHAVKLNATESVRFTGGFNNENASIAVSSGAANNFNLIGNPYLANVSVSEMVTANAALLEEQTVWLWDEGENAYTQKNLSQDLEVAPGQGFFVLTNAAGNFSITEAMQSHYNIEDTFKSSDNRPEINLVMTNGADVRDADIYYIDGTTTGFDNGYDSSIFGGVTNEFAIYTQAVANGTGRDLGIQSLPNNDFENMVIPVGINATSGTEIIISATSTNLPTGIHVYLEDKDDNSFTLLDDSSTFQTTFTNTSNGVGRFFIHTKTQPLSTDQAELNNVSIYLSNDNSLRIVGVQQGDTQVHIYSILGKQVVSTSFEGAGVNDILLPNLSMGIYMVQLKTKNGKLNKKIIIQQ